MVSPRLDTSTSPVLGLNVAARERRTWPRCGACGERLHPSLSRVGTHVLCSSLPPAVYDALAGWTLTPSDKR